MGPLDRSAIDPLRAVLLDERTPVNPVVQRVPSAVSRSPLVPAGSGSSSRPDRSFRRVRGEQVVAFDRREGEGLVADLVEKDGDPVLLAGHDDSGPPLGVAYAAVELEAARGGAAV